MISFNRMHSWRNLLFSVLCASIITHYMATGESYKVVCYLGSWANYRNGDGKFTIEDIEPSQCTHLMYGFAKLGDDNKITPFDRYLDLKENYGLGAYQRFTGLKQRYPNLKTLIAIGGWNEGSVKYSNMATNPSSRKTFVDSCISFLKEHNFDGLDFDWEYPSNRGGKPSDKQNFAILLKELKEAFKPHGFLLTAAVSAGKNTIDTAYDVPEISKHLDFINIMAYDFHGAWESVTGHNAPLYAKRSDSASNQMLVVDYAVKYWLQKGAPAKKLILGMPLYGRSFTLRNSNENGLGAPADGPGKEGSLTREAGYLGYNEVCLNLKNGWISVFDNDYKAPYAYQDRQWVGYDDVQSITLKVEYLKRMNLGGGMVWSIETDDFRGKCGERYPLLKAINRALRVSSPTETDREFNLSDSPDSVSASTEAEIIRSKFTEEMSSVQPREDTTRADEVCSKSGYVRDPENCKKFLYCEPKGSQGYRVYKFDCAPGTVFSENLQTCAFPYDVPECK